MEIKHNPYEAKADRQPYVLQIQVRSDLHSGQGGDGGDGGEEGLVGPGGMGGSSLEMCQFNLNKWRDRYYYWYNLARQQGKI